MRTWPRFHHVPAALRKRRHGATEHLPHLPRAGTRHTAVPCWQHRGEIEAWVFAHPEDRVWGSQGFTFPSQPGKSLWTRHPNPTRWHLGDAARSASIQGRAEPGNAGSAAPQNIPSSNSLPFQDDFCLKFWIHTWHGTKLSARGLDPTSLKHSTRKAGNKLRSLRLWRDLAEAWQEV